jgi:uncharacterized protein (UPF0335 family)
MSEIGHNSMPPEFSDKIMKVIERVENLEEEIKGLQEDRKEVYAVAKASGLDVTALRKVVARRKRDREAVKEEDDMITIMEEALYRELAG